MQQRKSSEAAFFANDVTRANWANQLRTQKNCRRQNLPAAVFHVFYKSLCSLHHTHAACTAGGHCRSVFLNACNNGFGCQQCACNAGCVLQCASGNLCRIQNTCFYHIYIRLHCRASKPIADRGLSYLVDDNAAFQTCVCCDMVQRSFQCLQDNLRTGLLIAFQCICQASATSLHAWIYADPPPAMIPSSTAALVAARASSIRSFASFISVSVAAPTRITATPPASFASLSCSFSLSKSEVVSSICALDLCDSCCDCILVACTINDDGVLFLNLNRFCTAEHIHCGIFQFKAKLSEMITCPPVRIAISSSIAFLLSP